MYNNINYKL